MKLKTLKDIDRWDEEMDYIDEEMCLSLDEDGEYILIEDLKQEAIKWIKELESNRKITLEKNGTYVKPYEDAIRYFCKEWIKHFFNIKKKDLK